MRWSESSKLFATSTLSRPCQGATQAAPQTSNGEAACSFGTTKVNAPRMLWVTEVVEVLQWNSQKPEAAIRA